jgi:hypothetical protein
VAAGLETCVGIVRFRKGPEDLPASTALLVATVAGSVLLGAVTLALIPEPNRPPAVPVLAIDVGATLLFLRLLLNAAGHPERFTQTATAFFGLQVVLAPALLGSAWLLLTYARDPNWQGPALVVRVAIEVWVFAIAARVLRSATGWPVIACLMLVIAAELAVWLMVSSLFPAPPAATDLPPAASST